MAQNTSVQLRPILTQKQKQDVLSYESLVERISGVTSRMIEIHARQVPHTRLPSGSDYETIKERDKALQRELTQSVIKQLQETLL